MLADDGLVPKGFVAEEGKYGVAVFVGFGFDGPPEEQRNMDVVGVFAALGEVFYDGHRLRGGEATGRGGKLAADFDAWVAIGEVGQNARQVVGYLTVVTRQTDSPEADVGVHMAEHGQFQM